mgnify:FL=1
MVKKKINGLLISAGFSGRMGAFKPLMTYEGEPFVVVITKKLLIFCDRVVIVTGFKNDQVESIINSTFYTLHSSLKHRVVCVYNSNYEKGMFTSLQTGLKELTDSNWVLFHFVDKPFHKEKFYKDFISQIDENYDWIQPMYDGKEGHPVMFKKTVFEKIITSPENHILRLIRDDGLTKKKKWECSYSQILKDFDAKEDFEKFSENQ